MTLDTDDLPDEMDLASSRRISSRSRSWLRGREKSFLEEDREGGCKVIDEEQLGSAKSAAKRISVKSLLEARPETIALHPLRGKTRSGCR